VRGTGTSGKRDGGVGEKRLTVECTDFIKGNWIVRSCVRGVRVIERKKYLYLGVFAPAEPMLAVWYDDEKDELFTEPVQAFVARVVCGEPLPGTQHVVEFLPVECYIEGGEGWLEVIEDPNFLGVVPARRFEEVREDFLKAGRRRGGVG
jgi:hypothetical protein